MSPVLSLTTSKLILAVSRYSKPDQDTLDEAHRMDWYRQDHYPDYDDAGVDELAYVAVLSDN